MKKIIAITAISTVALFMGAQTVSAHRSGDDVTVTNTNTATVNNGVTVGAYTGGNYAFGGNAIGRNATGGNNSGDISTGDAYARAKIVNIVNSSKTMVSAPCANCGGDVEVTNNNKANVGNGVGVTADTGMNGVGGGDATATSAGHHHGGSGTATGGNNSGNIETGDAYASAKVVNVVNKTVTRIRR